MAEWNFRIRAKIDEDSGQVIKMTTETLDDGLVKDWAEWDAEHPYVPGVGREGGGSNATRSTLSSGAVTTGVSGDPYKELQAGVKDAGKSWSPDEKASMDRWTGGKGGVRAFQNGTASDKASAAFNSALESSPKVGGAYVYRGVSPSGESADFQSKLNVGDTVHLGEPVSTSIDPSLAAGFGTNIYEIDSPSAAYVGSNSKYPQEKEAILAPGDFRVTSTEMGTVRIRGKDAPVYIVHLQDVSSGSRSYLPDGSKDFHKAAADDDEDRSERFMEKRGELGNFQIRSKGHMGGTKHDEDGKRV